jgi:hypothetical protein
VSHLAPGFDGACYRFLPKHAMADVALWGGPSHRRQRGAQGKVKTRLASIVRSNISNIMDMRSER